MDKPIACILEALSLLQISKENIDAYWEEDREAWIKKWKDLFLEIAEG